jgi:cytochrome c-type biogenesis protein CcmH
MNNSNNRMLLFLLLLALILLSAVHIASAQDGGTNEPPVRTVTDDEVNAIAAKLYCPVCENIPLDVCGTEACADWRDEIRTMLEQGQSEEQILAYFENRYGDRVLATPRREGINLVVWIAPPAVLIIGAGLLILVLRRMAPSKASAANTGAALHRYDNLDAEYVARLEADLKEMS